MKERGRERGEEQERPEQQVSDDRWGDKEWRTYIGADIRKTSQKTGRETENGNSTKGYLKREQGREEKSRSRDLSNRSLKTDGKAESGEPT